MDLVHIGKIVASFGLQGEVILKHSLGKKTVLKKGDVLFIENIKDSHLPYFVEESKAKSLDETYLKLEGFATKESTARILQKRAWLTQEVFNKLVDKTAPIGLLGYAIINDAAPIGVIEEVIEQPHQVLARILYKNREAFIPLHHETLIKIDRNKKQVFVRLPEGLLEVYL